MFSLTRISSAIVLLWLAAANVQAEWRRYPMGTMSWLHSIYFVDDNNGWIVGSMGTLLSTTDGGTTWVVTKKITRDNIRDVYFADSQHGWLLCEASIFESNTSVSYLLVTVDGGRTWQRNDAFPGRDRMVRLFFLNAKFGCAVGESGSFWCLGDDQSSWQKRALPVRYLMLDGRALNKRSLVLVGGGGTMMHTSDAGTTWTLSNAPVSKSKINSVHFIDEKKGYAVGVEGKIFSTRNGGLSWESQTSPISMELNDVLFQSQTKGYAVGDEGTIIQTTTGGAEWSVEASNTKYRLEGLAATNIRVFAVGFGGTMLVKDIVSSDDSKSGH